MCAHVCVRLDAHCAAFMMHSACLLLLGVAVQRHRLQQKAPSKETSLSQSTRTCVPRAGHRRANARNATKAPITGNQSTAPVLKQDCAQLQARRARASPSRLQTVTHLLSGQAHSRCHVFTKIMLSARADWRGVFEGEHAPGETALGVDYLRAREAVREVRLARGCQLHIEQVTAACGGGDIHGGRLCQCMSWGQYRL